jgi:hypothetical protein
MIILHGEPKAVYEPEEPGWDLIHTVDGQDAIDVWNSFGYSNEILTVTSEFVPDEGPGEPNIYILVSDPCLVLYTAESSHTYNLGYYLMCRWDYAGILLLQAYGAGDATIAVDLDFETPSNSTMKIYRYYMRGESIGVSVKVGEIVLKTRIENENENYTETVTWSWTPFSSFPPDDPA